MAGGGLPSLTGVLLDAQLTTFGVVRKPTKNQGQGGFRVGLIGSSRSPSYSAATLKLGAPYLVGASFTRLPIQAAVLTITGGPVNLAGSSLTRSLEASSVFTPGTSGGGNAGAANYRYVGVTATGNGSGSSWANRAQWSTVSFQRGNVYYVMAGTYVGRTLSTANNNTQRIIIKSATVADHGEDISGGWNNSMAGLVAFTGGMWISSGYWTLDGQTGGGPGSWVTNFGMQITNTATNEAVITQDAGADNRYLHIKLVGMNRTGTDGGGSGNDGIALKNFSTENPGWFTASYIWFFGIGRCPLYTPHTGSVGYTVEYSYVDRFNFGSSVHAEVCSTYGVSSTSCLVTYRYNIITDIESTGGLQWSATGSSGLAQFHVYGNVFYRPAGRTWAPAGNGIIGGWTGNPTGDRETWHNTKVYNNTFYNCVGTQVYPTVAFAIETPHGHDCRNNLFITSSDLSFDYITTHDYNAYFNSGGTHSETNSVNLASDPISDPASLNFTPNSVVIPSGTSLSAPFNVDMYGNTRQPGNWTRGAVQKV